MGKEREKVEALKERYLMWVLEVEGKTPGYLIREELQWEKLRGRSGKRAWKFEERLEKGRGSDIARKCLEEREVKKRESGFEVGRETRRIF